MALRREPVPQHGDLVILRELRRIDLPSCCRIDRMTAHGEPWNEATWFDATKEFSTVVATQNNLVAGFVVYDRRLRHMQVMKLAVHPHVQRTGIGSCLLGRVFEHAVLTDKKFVQATVTLTAPLVPALALFKYLNWAGYLTEDGSGVCFVKENRLASKISK